MMNWKQTALNTAGAAVALAAIAAGTWFAVNSDDDDFTVPAIEHRLTSMSGAWVYADQIEVSGGNVVGLTQRRAGGLTMFANIVRESWGDVSVVFGLTADDKPDWYGDTSFSDEVSYAALDLYLALEAVAPGSSRAAAESLASTGAEESYGSLKSVVASRVTSDLKWRIQTARSTEWGNEGPHPIYTVTVAPYNVSGPASIDAEEVDRAAAAVEGQKPSPLAALVEEHPYAVIGGGVTLVALMWLASTFFQERRMKAQINEIREALSESTS